MGLEQHFASFREKIVGQGGEFYSLHGKQPLIYADWIASGRLYGPIEDTMCNEIGPMVANTHSFSSETGKASTYAYRHARQIIKDHVNANENDVLVTTGTGMTGALARLQRIMGLRIPDAKTLKESTPAVDRPVVFLTHMEHHSNQVPWMETLADVVLLPCDGELNVNPQALEEALAKYADRKLKIGAFTAASNVTGIITPYSELAKIMHKHGGICIMDFAASAPYVAIDMHPSDPEAKLDAVLFSPHKFLGGPGTCGILVFDKKLYQVPCPDVPGGGNVKWTDPWGNYKYYDDIETKEDGGTPGFLQVMRAAMCMRLKDKMGTENIAAREEELLAKTFEQLRAIPNISIFGDNRKSRIGVVSFNVDGAHYNLIVRLLNDRFGIQVRGGWSCASTYGHHLFGIDAEKSSQITQGILTKNLGDKPGWVRLSLHPVTSNKELDYILNAIQEVAKQHETWSQEYTYNPSSNEFEHASGDQKILETVESWFV